GQILETHLGWASAGLGKQIGALLDGISRGRSKMDDLRGRLGELYDTGSVEDIKEMSDDEVVELSHNLTRGIPFATPVFDGARQSEIDTLLREAGVATSGQVTLIDGRTGEPFVRPVTVGYIYMLK